MNARVTKSDWTTWSTSNLQQNCFKHLNIHKLLSFGTLRMNLTAVCVIVHKQLYIMAVVWHAIFCPAEKSILASISLSCTCCHVIRAIHFLHVTTYLIFLTSSVCEVWASGSISSATRPCSTSARNFSRPDNMNGQPKCRGSASAVLMKCDLLCTLI